MAVIYAFGDSITYGAWDIKEAGWATRLRIYLDKKQEADENLYYLFYNLGIPGETTQGLVKRFQPEVLARERKNEDVIFIFAYGANDAVYLPTENSFKISKKDFGSNFEKVIAQANSISGTIFIVNILPVVDEINQIPRNGKVRLTKYMEEYNDVLKPLAQKHRIPLVDVFSVFMETGHTRLFCEDGVHPNEEGHKLMFQTIVSAIEKAL